MKRESLFEAARYVIVGALTTLVNLGVKWVVLLPFPDPPGNFALSLAVALGWIGSVAFAYAANKLCVFKTRGLSRRDTLVEAGRFVSARLLSLAFDWAFVLAAVNWLHMGEWWAMIVSNVLVVILNYVASKLWIFKRR